ncbi:MAG: UbiA family prenyltransferase [Deltaproteobacteria bacterium]|nr:UbiA family prenyltransferase [Deltaproteobacteria bacterium]
MIKFSHTAFALPFALSAVVLAHDTDPLSIYKIFWILAAMVGARSAAMGFNRIADARLDAENPRTAERAIPSGILSIRSAAVFVILSSALFIFSAVMLSSLCFYFSFPVLALLLGYSYAKRFTRFCHFYLGFAISLAPMGAWVAMTGRFSWGILFLSAGLAAHIAGFDIIYACQDTRFDADHDLFSLPSRSGVGYSLKISSWLHVAAVLFFAVTGLCFGLGGYYFVSVGLVAIMFAIEHLIVSPSDLTHINIAFFYINSMISVVLFFGILADSLLPGGLL